MRLEHVLLAASATAVLSILIAMDPLHLFSLPNMPRASNTTFQSSEFLPITGAAGPESLAFDPDGRGPYTGVSDGRILRWRAEDRVWEEFAITSPHWKDECKGRQHGVELEHICGRPLGLQFNKNTGELYVADAYFGLLVVGPEGGLAKRLVTQAQDVPFRLTNALDIDHETGLVYFTDSSAHFQRRDFLLAIISGDKTGRVMRYDPQSKQTKVLLDGLSFPNGVALSRDGSFLLIAETTTGRVLRLWLHTSRAGTSEVLAHLPGFPDNIRRSPGGDFWVALHSRRGRLLGWLLSNAWLGKVGLWLVRPLSSSKLQSLMSSWRKSDGMGLKLSGKGEVLEVLDGTGGMFKGPVTEVDERDGKLWIGSLNMPFVAIYLQN